MPSWSWKTGLASVTIVAATAYAVAQMPTGHDGMHAQIGPSTLGQQLVSPESGMHGPMHERMMQMMHAASRECTAGCSTEWGSRAE